MVSEEDRPAFGAWGEIAAPLVQRLEVAAAVGGSASWNATGADAFAKLLKQMITCLDTTVPDVIATRDTAIEKLTASNDRLSTICEDAVKGLHQQEAEIRRLRAMVVALGGDPAPTPVAPAAADPAG